MGECLLVRRGGSGGFRLNPDILPFKLNFWVSDNRHNFSFDSSSLCFQKGNCLISCEMPMKYRADFTSGQGGRALLYYDAQAGATTILEDVRYVTIQSEYNDTYEEQPGGFVKINADGYTFYTAGGTRSGVAYAIPVL